MTALFSECPTGLLKQLATAVRLKGREGNEVGDQMEDGAVHRSEYGGYRLAGV
jgi:hypothetical protein